MWHKRVRCHHVESDILKRGPGAKHPGRWEIAEHQIPSIKALFKTNTKSHEQSHRASGQEQKVIRRKHIIQPRPVVNGMERMCQRHGNDQTPTLLFEPKTYMSNYRRMGASRIWSLTQNFTCVFYIYPNNFKDMIKNVYFFFAKITVLPCHTQEYTMFQATDFI